MTTLFNFRGYTQPDPLDKGSRQAGLFILVLVNIVLTGMLLYAIQHYKIVYFQGFRLFGISFPPLATEILELLINGFVFPVLIFATRKCSSLVPFLIVLLPYFLLDLYIESHYRCPICDHTKALWMYYKPSVISGIEPSALKFLVTLSVDALLFGVLSLFFARVVAAMIYRKKAYKPAPTKEQFDNLFRAEWSIENIGRPQRDLSFYLLRIMGLGYFLYLFFLVLGKLGPDPWPVSMGDLFRTTYSNPALAINTYFKISLMVILSFTAAYNKSLRYYCCTALFVGHLISTAYSLTFHFYGPLQGTDKQFLLVSGLLDGSMAIIFLIILLAFKNEGDIFISEKDSPVDWSIPLTLQKMLYGAMSAFFILLVVVVVWIRLKGHSEYGIGAIFGNPDPLISNSITMYGTLATIFYFQIKREQLRAYLFNPVLIPIMGCSVLAFIWLTVVGSHHGLYIVTRNHARVQVDWFFVLEGGLGLIISFVFIGLRRMFYTVDYSINSMNPSAAIDCLALADAFFGGEDSYHANDKQRAELLRSVDNYIGGIRGRKRGLLNLPFGLFENVLNFVYGFHPPFSAMSREEQRYYLRKYFLRNEWERKRAFLPPLAQLAYQAGIALNTLVSFAQFNQLNVRNIVGYVPADARDRLQGDCATSDPPYDQIAPLPTDYLDPNNYKKVSDCADGPIVAPRATTAVREDEIPIDADYIIIGSGAGGATAAYRLACASREPSRILVLESGSRYQPLQDFSDDEMDMFKKLYKEGGLQQTKKFTLTIAQGECLGGSTVVNNAVCFKMPASVQDDWQNGYGIDLTDLNAEYEQIKKELSIQPLGSRGINRPVRKKFDDAVIAYNQTAAPGEVLTLEDNVLVNQLNNLGDGNWNIGNKRMRKRSMLETYIPWSEARGVKFISNMHVVGFQDDGNGHAKSVVVRQVNGKMTKIRINKALIIAGGAVASSQILMRSGLNIRGLGQELSCNFAFPVTLDFKEEMRAFDGEQITRAALDPQLRSAFETYFNPPAAFSLTSVPFFFDRRKHIMMRYKHLMNIGSLIGSEANGVIHNKANLVDGQSFSWELGSKDVAHIKYAFQTIIRLSSLAGARRVILPTRPGLELDLSDKNNESLFVKAIAGYPLRITDLYIGTAHPQGGNPMAGNDGMHTVSRVVDEDFKVVGTDNVFVADASLFPTSITVNPQWTIMAMSGLAMKSVLRLFP